MAKLHVIVHLSLDGRIFILKRKHTDVKCVARLLPKDHSSGTHWSNTSQMQWVWEKLYVEFRYQDFSHLIMRMFSFWPWSLAMMKAQFMILWDGLHTDPRCQVIVMGASNHAMPANLENSAVATGLEKVSFHSNPKERQCQRMLKLPHNCTHLTR